MFKVYIDRKFFVNIRIGRNYRNFGTLLNFLYRKNLVEIYDINTNQRIINHGELIVLLDDARKNTELKVDEELPNTDSFKDLYPFKIYFLNIPNLHADALISQHGFAVICPENFEMLWNRLTFAGRIDITSDNNAGAINNFNQLINYIFSRFNFGIIQDPYLISKDNNKASFKFFIKSIFSLQNLKLLLLKEPNKDDTLEQMQNQFNNIIGSIGEIKNQPVLLVKKELGDNDRHCFTNYYYINLNHSLNAFNDSGKVVNNQQLNIESYFVNLTTFSRDLERMKEKVNYVYTHQDQIINREEAADTLNTIRSFFIENENQNH